MRRKWLFIDFRDLPLPVLLVVMPATVIVSVVIINTALLAGSSLLLQQDVSLISGLRELFGIKETAELSLNFSGSTFVEAPVLWLLLISIPVWSLSIQLANLYLNGQRYGVKKNASIHVSHFLTNVLHVVVAFVCLGFFVEVVQALTGERLLYSNVVAEIRSAYDSFIASIPTIVDLPRPLAFVIAVLAMDLPIYIVHRLLHESRFLWYICHRSHHTPELLNPSGNGPVFGFDFIFTRFPMFLVGLVVFKLVSPGSILLELTIYLYLRHLLEILNHCSSFYRICRENRFVYFLTAIFGCGSFHYTHHSAIPGQEKVNIANELFCFWDRVFGTYVTPPLQKPLIGLTNQPDVKLNPFVLLFSGWQTILYELTHNPPSVWHKILFGPVSYEPENSKDYLLVEPVH